MKGLTYTDVELAKEFNASHLPLYVFQDFLYPFDDKNDVASTAWVAFTMLFQERHGLTVDGKFGPKTLAMYCAQMGITPSATITITTP